MRAPVTGRPLVQSDLTREHCGRAGVIKAAHASFVACAYHKSSPPPRSRGCCTWTWERSISISSLLACWSRSRSIACLPDIPTNPTLRAACCMLYLIRGFAARGRDRSDVSGSRHSSCRYRRNPTGLCRFEKTPHTPTQQKAEHLVWFDSTKRRFAHVCVDVEEEKSDMHTTEPRVAGSGRAFMQHAVMQNRGPPPVPDAARVASVTSAMRPRTKYERDRAEMRDGPRRARLLGQTFLRLNHDPSQLIRAQTGLPRVYMSMVSKQRCATRVRKKA